MRGSISAASKIEASIIRIGFEGMFYYNHHKGAPKIVKVIMKALY